ncbi:transporter [Undibacterium sp. LFS511W]|uniref:Transporter n=1 Tax=Undibacterium luofuense TaxID=2828733 RepID=A0A941DIT2_9BURK|nr:transporter [Undibacterium luofuense]
MASYADDEKEDGVTPYRPSVSNTAFLPQTGQLELEAGFTRSRSDGLYRDSVPYLLKLAFNPRWGVLLGGDAHLRQQNDDGSTQRGIGDTSITLKYAYALDDKRALGLEFGNKLPTAKFGLGSGKTDYVLNGIWSYDDGSRALDINLNTSRLGFAEPGSSAWQTGLSAAASWSVAEKTDLTAELSTAYRRGTASQHQLLMAVSYSPTPKMTLDIGFTRGLAAGSPDWSVFTGIVIPLGKLF